MGAALTVSLFFYCHPFSSAFILQYWSGTICFQLMAGAGGEEKLFLFFFFRSLTFCSGKIRDRKTLPVNQAN